PALAVRAGAGRGGLRDLARAALAGVEVPDEQEDAGPNEADGIPSQHGARGAGPRGRSGRSAAREEDRWGGNRRVRERTARYEPAVRVRQRRGGAARGRDRLPGPRRDGGFGSAVNRAPAQG